MIGFRSKCYSLQSHYMQWADANNGCKIIGGQLATIDSYSVNNFLFRRFRRGQSLNAWFGLKRCTSYRWCYPNGRRSSYRRWNINEPNNVGRNENCVEMLDNGRWNDAPCTQRRPSFCEIPGILLLCVSFIKCFPYLVWLRSILWCFSCAITVVASSGLKRLLCYQKFSHTQRHFVQCNEVKIAS